MITLRPYQQAAIAATYEFLRQNDGDPVLVAPTGSGKSILLAQIAKDAVTVWNGRVLIVTHVRELIEQNADKVRRLCPEVPVGIYSASLNGRDTTQPVICAGIQSIYQRARELGAFDLILVDEAHLLSGDEDSMYGQFLTDARGINTDCRLIGLTATPFRMSSGLIYGPGRLFADVCYQISIKELIRDGYLSPLVTKAGRAKVDTDTLHVRGGEFVADEAEALMDRDDVVEAACAEIVELTRDRQACLIFAAGVRHAQHVVETLERRHGLECGLLTGETPSRQRSELISRFRGEPSGALFETPPLKYLCGVNAISTGLDVPRIDALALLRPTMSPGLYCQMVGRSFRLNPGKSDALILDFAGNVLRHGPVDAVRVQEKGPGQNGGPPPAKECPKCRGLIATAYRICPQCGFQFPEPEKSSHEASASDEGILSGQVIDREMEVRDVIYSVHTKKDADESAPKTFRVDYRLGLDYWVSEWICFEHQGWPRRKAEQWCKQRCPDPVPDSSEEAVDVAERGRLAVTEFVTVRSVVGEKFDRIIGYKLGPLPPACPLFEEPDWSDIPF